ncbi:hypothetical protein A2U01_0068397, partial [Trifolium medium]|nr:hypothetical protein [Trifolium medium]
TQPDANVNFLLVPVVSGGLLELVALVGCSLLKSVWSAVWLLEFSFFPGRVWSVKGFFQHW